MEKDFLKILKVEQSFFFKILLQFFLELFFFHVNGLSTESGLKIKRIVE